MNTPSLSQKLLVLNSVLSALVLLSLLVGFGLVVERAVRRAEALRHANALLTEATWRCKVLKIKHLRETCVQRFLRDRGVDSAGTQTLAIASDASTPRTLSWMP